MIERLLVLQGGPILFVGQDEIHALLTVINYNKTNQLFVTLLLIHIQKYTHTYIVLNK